MALLAVAIAGTALVGVFFLGYTDWYLERSLHGPVALAFFVGAPIANLLLGTGAFGAGDRRWGVVTVATGLAHVLPWGGWLLAMRVGLLEPGAWFGLAEFVAVFLFGRWTAVAAGRLLSSTQR